VNRDFVTRSRYREGGGGWQHAKSCPATKNPAIFLCFTASTRRRGVDDHMAASWSKKWHFIGISVANASRFILFKSGVSTTVQQLPSSPTQQNSSYIPRYLIQPAVSCISFHYLTIPFSKLPKSVCAQNTVMAPSLTHDAHDSRRDLLCLRQSWRTLEILDMNPCIRGLSHAHFLSDPY
jgi:hypothetical protein